jgi:hypothetical protein
MAYVGERRSRLTAVRTYASGQEALRETQRASQHCMVWPPAALMVLILSARVTA